MIKTLGIIGHGHFGAFIERLAKEFAPKVEVKIFSRKTQPDGQKFFSLAKVCETDALVLATPIASFEGVLNEILPLLAQHTTLIDVATVKMHTTKLLREAKVLQPNLQFVATHPMFGPFSYEKKGNSLSDLRLVVCDHTLEQETFVEFRTFAEVLGLVVLEMSAEVHDKMLAETLFLTHYIGQIVHAGGFERTTIDTVSFGFLMDAVESVRQDAQLFRDVYQYNPFCKEVIARFERAETQTEHLLADTKE